MQTKNQAKVQLQANAKNKLHYVPPKATFVPITSDQRFKSCKGENANSNKAIFSRDPACA